MDKIGVKIGLNRHPRAIVILCEILRQACKSCEICGICGIRVSHSHRFRENQREDGLWEFVVNLWLIFRTRIARIIRICGAC